MTRKHGVSRRRFLQGVGAGTLGLAGASLAGSAVAAEEPARGSVVATPASGEITQLSEHLAVYHGPINVGLIRDGATALLIDCGDGSVARRFSDLGIATVQRVIFTHHHRDQACGVYSLLDRGAKIGVPAAEREHFDAVEFFWNDPKTRWHVYKLHPHHLMLAEPVAVDAAYSPGDTLRFGPAAIGVISTPGHTDGSVSYLVEVDGRRVIFCGDAIYDEGQVWEIHSLQKGFRRGNREVRDYHGFLGARDELVESLGRIKEARPELLVPSHGRVMNEPARAVDRLIERLEACYDKYVAISALRHYFPALFEEYAGREGHMPLRPPKEVPACLRHFGTTWMLVSQDKAAFAMACGSARVITEIQKLIDANEINAVEGLWVTHYHDDHVDSIPEFQEAFDCPCYADGQVARVIADPMAWRLPCTSPIVARVDRVTRNGDSWPWHEFTMTAYYFPGQTLYHGALLVEGRGLKMLFVGDSFTMGGIDDYCSSNRNWLGPGVGFDRCIALIEELRPTHLFNCHVAGAFDFTPEQCRFMRRNLAERETLYGDLVPWDHANYGMDEPWVRCAPYEQRAAAGSEVTLGVVITNHSPTEQNAACRAVMPRAWDRTPADWTTATITPKTEQELRLAFRVGENAKPGRYAIPVDVRFAARSLPQFTEAVIVVT
jgi:glyoxylase-like metal-dependent hydrolase (beta-lactamase superfamily II)